MQAILSSLRPRVREVDGGRFLFGYWPVETGRLRIVKDFFALNFHCIYN